MAREQAPQEAAVPSAMARRCGRREFFITLLTPTECFVVNHTKLPLTTIRAPSVERNAIQRHRRADRRYVAGPFHGAAPICRARFSRRTSHRDVWVHRVTVGFHARCFQHAVLHSRDERDRFISSFIEYDRQGGRSMRISRRVDGYR